MLLNHSRVKTQDHSQFEKSFFFNFSFTFPGKCLEKENNKFQVYYGVSSITEQEPYQKPSFHWFLLHLILLTLSTAIAGVVLDVAPMLGRFFSDRMILLITVNCLRTVTSSFRKMCNLFAISFRSYIPLKKRFCYI
jgi:hypothetical protein